MNILHISAHLPPEGGASALLPVQVAAWCRDAGDDVRFVTYRTASAAGVRTRPPRGLPGQVCWVMPPEEVTGPLRALGAAHVACAARAARDAGPAVQWADVVHVHGASAVAQAGALLAGRVHKPVVLTLYGPEVRGYQARRWWSGTFARAYREAAHVTFTSHGLLARAIERGLARRHTTVAYPPVASAFGVLDDHRRAAARSALGIRARHVLLCVRALDATGGHRHLLEALGEVIRTHPDTRLILIGTGSALSELRATARAWGVEGHVTFAGRVDHDVVAQYDASADVFVMPSLVEGVSAAALEALASGCPVIAADTDGARELHELFGFDVATVPRENAMAFARAIVQALGEKRRVRQGTTELIDREHRADTTCAQYRAIYTQVLARAVPQAVEPALP